MVAWSLVCAIVFTILIVFTSMFHVALSLGARWGSFCMGGKYAEKSLPKSVRIGICLNHLIYALLLAIVLTRARLILPSRFDLSQTAIWFVVAFNTLGLFLNLITPSVMERAIWAPVTGVLLLTTLGVALS